MVKKEKLMSISNLLIMSVTFLLLGFFISLDVSLQTAIKSLEEQAQITVFFKDDFPEDSIKTLKSELEKDKRISSVNYISKEDALNIFKEINKDEPILLESISASILPASLEIKASNVGELEIISTEVEQKDGVEEVRFLRDVVGRFKTWSHIVYIFGFVLVAIFLTISYSVVIGMLRTVINSRGTELEIMKLVGASDDFVKKPLVYQGVFFGLLSSGIASLLMIISGFVLNFTGVYAKGLTLGFISGLYINPVLFMLLVSIILLLSGFMLGYFGSISAIKKYLKY